MWPLKSLLNTTIFVTYLHQHFERQSMRSVPSQSVKRGGDCTNLSADVTARLVNSEIFLFADQSVKTEKKHVVGQYPKS
jgi:hypothetical protein